MRTDAFIYNNITDDYLRYIGKDGQEYRTIEELEIANKIYFEKFIAGISDKDTTQQEKEIADMKESFNEYLKEYGSVQQNNNPLPRI